MNKKSMLKTLLCITLLIQTACVKTTTEEAIIKEQVAIIKAAFAPDKRTSIFAITSLPKNHTVLLTGESNVPAAVDALKAALKTKGYTVQDSIRMLPALDLGDNTQGVIKISVANLRTKPKHAAELATQASLGTPVKVLKQQESWYLIQTPDSYIAWVDAGGIELMDTERYNRWKKADKIIYKKTYGFAYHTQEQVGRVSDLVAGAVLERTATDANGYTVLFPDGREAFVAIDEAEDYQTWVQNLQPSTDALVQTAKTLMGVPYVWGGTSTKGLDCSGFTKTIYFLNGTIIPRDASQQVHTGILIDSTANFTNLEQGDLLFFGRKANDSLPEKVVHVGMWIGNNQFIHASEMVRISSVDTHDDAYDAYNVNRYLKAKRMVNHTEKGILHLKHTALFKE